MVALTANMTALTHLSLKGVDNEMLDEMVEGLGGHFHDRLLHLHLQLHLQGHRRKRAKVHSVLHLTALQTFQNLEALEVVDILPSAAMGVDLSGRYAIPSLQSLTLSSIHNPAFRTWPFHDFSLDPLLL
jgi:hypothetical protein